MVSQISIFIVQSGPIKNSLVAFSTRTAAEEDEEEEDEEAEPNDEIIFFFFSFFTENLCLLVSSLLWRKHVCRGYIHPLSFCCPRKTRGILGWVLSLFLVSSSIMVGVWFSLFFFREFRLLFLLSFVLYVCVYYYVFSIITFFALDKLILFLIFR